MKHFIFLFLAFISLRTFAQSSDTVISVFVSINRDYRLDILEKKEADINSAIAKNLARTAMGYRLQVLSTNDREFAMKTRTQLLQKFPEQKPYMIYQAPYVKLTFGNFITKQEAEFYKNQISRMMGGASVYILSQRIEVKPDKTSADDINK